MTHAVGQQPSKIFRGTIDEVLSRRSEIPTGTVVELRVFNNAASVTPSESVETLAVEPSKPKQLKALGMMEGPFSVDDFLRRKHEETLAEDRKFR